MGHRVTVASDVPASGGPPRSFPFKLLSRPPWHELLRSVRECDVFLHNNVSLKVIWPQMIVRPLFVAVHHTTYAVGMPRRDLRERMKVQIARRWASNISVSTFVQKKIGVGGSVIPNAYD